MISCNHGKWHFDFMQCRQCGVCIGSCPTGALSARIFRDRYEIICDAESCVCCGLCAKCCPANEETAVNTSADLKAARVILRVWSADPSTRYWGSSGGSARSLIRAVLAERRCDAVYTLVHSGSAPEATGCWLTAYPGDESDIPTSLYRPVLWGENLGKVDPAWKSVLLVGLPCQLRAARKFLHHRLPDTEILAVTIFCKKQKTFGYSRYWLRRFGASFRETGQLRYRGGGWPGGCRLRDGTRAGSFFYPATCWNLPGCRYCLDSLNRRDSDLTLADPWGLVPIGPEEPGQNLVFVWTGTGQKLLASSAVVCGPTVTAKEAGDSLPLSALAAKAEALCLVRPGSPAWLRRLWSALKKKIGEIYMLLIAKG